MSRDFIASQQGREFKKSPNRDRLVKGGWQPVYISIYKVELTTTSQSVPYFFDLGTDTYTEAVEAVNDLRDIPYPSTPGTKTVFLDLRDRTTVESFAAVQPVLIAGAGGFFLERVVAFSAFEARRGRIRQGNGTYLIGSSYYLSKIKVVFNVPTFSPFCVSSVDNYYEIGTGPVPVLTSHNQSCFRSRWTSEMGADSDASQFYSYSPQSRTIEMGPRVVPWIDVPQIARDQFSFTINGQAVDDGAFSTWRKIAGVVYDSRGVAKILMNPRIGLNDEEIAPCCDLS